MPTKRCCHCNEPKDETEFNKCERRKDGLMDFCRKCHQNKGRAWRQRHPDRLKMLCRRNSQYIFEYLVTHPCVDCGEADILVLEFDHVRGTKKKSLSNYAKSNASLKTIQAEIDKCDVRCCNCHRRKTLRERGDSYRLKNFSQR